MVLDIEVGPDYFRGGPAAVRQFGAALRARIPAEFHLGLCLDARGNHPNDIHIQEWLPFVNSLHPMTYHLDFGVSPETAVLNAFKSLAKYQKPIVPMLQGYGLNNRDRDELRRGAKTAFDEMDAPGISIFRFGSLGPKEFEAIRKIDIPEPERGIEVTTFPFTNGQLWDAVVVVSQFLKQDGRWMIVSAGLDNLLDHPDRNYQGVAVRNLPGLTGNEKELIERVLNGQKLVEIVVDKPILGRFTNQQVINAFAEAADKLGRRDEYWTWVEQSGLAEIVKARHSRYTLKPLETLPLDAIIRAAVIKALVGVAPLGDVGGALPVPWVSQAGRGAANSFNDCGQACIAMFLRAYNQPGAGMTVDQLTQMLGGTTGKTGVEDLRGLARRASNGGLQLERLQLRPELGAMGTLRSALAQRKPIILLVQWVATGFQRFGSADVAPGAVNIPHWFVVVGAQNDEFLINDPLFFATARTGKGGAAIPISAGVLDAARLAGGFVAIVPTTPLPVG
jgi:hypothetical protein